MSSDPIVGASLTSSGVVAKKAIIDEIALKENTITGISHEHTDTSIKSVPSSKALSDAIDVLQTHLREIDPNNNFFRDNTVITLPLISPSFSEDGEWIISEWTVHDGSISFVGKDFEIPNYIAIPNEIIPFTGHYFFYVNIPRLDSGKIVLYDQSGSILKIFDSYGQHPVEVYVSNPDIAEFKFVAESVFPGEAVTIDSVMFYRVTPRLKAYLNYMFSGGAGTGEVTYDMMQAAILLSQNNILNLMNNRISPIEDDLDLHVSNYNNPHNLTPVKIGAAPAVHTHTPISIGAAATIHTHEPEQCGAAPAVHTHTPNQVGAAPAVHAHVPADIGAADRVHTHTPSECDSAPVFHTHIPASIGAAPLYHEHSQYTTPSMVNGQIQSALSEFTLSGESSGAVKPMCVLGYDDSGSLPVGYEDTLLSSPVSPVILSELVHRSKHYYDFYEGMALTSKETDPGHPIEYAFKKHLDQEDSQVSVAAFAGTTVDLNPNVVVEYVFHTKRSISGFTLVKDLTLQILGVPVELDLVVDGRFVTSVSGLDPVLENSWSLTEDSHEFDLGFSASGKRFTFVVKKIHPDLISGLWGIKILFHFDDVDSGAISSTSPISLGVNNSFGTRLVELSSLDSSVDPVVIPIVDESTHLYVFSSVYRDDDLDKSVLYLSPYPMEFSNKQSGRPVFIDKFTNTRSHPLLGTISCSSENVLENPLNYLFSSGESSWESALGVTSAVITHQFIDSLNLSGYKLKFNENQISNFIYPDSWVLKGYYVDEFDVEQEVILDQVDYYKPSVHPEVFYHKQLSNTNLTFTKVELHLTGSQGQTRLGMNQFVILTSEGFFHIEKNQTSLSNVFPLGKIVRLSDYEGNPCFIYEGTTIGSHCHLPVDGMKMQPNLFKEHKIPNPFQSKNVKLELFTYSSPAALNPQGTITRITEDYIYLTTYTAGSYSLGISRLW